MTVEITAPAEEALREVKCRYKRTKGQKTVDAILDRAETLSNLADRGRIVEELRGTGQQHRYIIEGRYKIIYFRENDTVYVTDVFHMGMPPEKIRERNMER